MPGSRATDPRNSLQLNLAIIAACAPTLKPLVGHALKLTSNDKYYGDYYARNASSGPRSGRNRPATNDDDDVFELRQQAHFGRAHETYRTSIKAGKPVAMYDKYGDERSGSEEMILQGADGKGIMRTTEISIRQ